MNRPGFGAVKAMEMLCSLLHRVLYFRSVCLCFSFLFLSFSLSALSPYSLLVFLLSFPSMFLFSSSLSLPLCFCSLFFPRLLSVFSLFFHALLLCSPHVLSEPALPYSSSFSSLDLFTFSFFFFFLSFSPSVSCLFRSPSHSFFSLLLLSVVQCWCICDG